MKTIQQVIIERLLADASLTAIVSNRIKLTNLEQDSLIPNVCVSFISQIPLEVNGEASNAFTAYIQIDCFSKTLKEVLDIAKKIRLRLDYFSGTIDNIKVRNISFTNEESNYESEVEEYRQSLDFSILFQE